MVGEDKLRAFVNEIVERFPTDREITEEQAQEIVAYVEENSPRYGRGKNAGRPQVFADLIRQPDKGRIYPNGNVSKDDLYVVFFIYRGGRMTDGVHWTIALPTEVA